MRKYAVIDVGSNSVRLMFVADGKVLYKTLSTTRLGEGIAQTRTLSESAISRTVSAVGAFYDRAQKDGAEQVAVFATAAVRSAINGTAFVQAVKDACGLQVDVIDGQTEAEIGASGALGTGDGTIIDVGGASTEIAVKKDGKLIYKESVNVGVVRLKDVCGRDIRALQVYCKDKTVAFANAPITLDVYAIGGTATTLAAQFLQLEKYNSDLVTGTRITIEDMHNLADKLSSLSIEETAKLPCMPTGRADVLLGGTLWLIALMEDLKIPAIVVSDRDNLEGYAQRKGWL
ncbi:MAG: rod shape-determining protein [Clostridia bacterium]|nr:rod shape-determining protein [Clostridia bacterium]